MKLGIFGIAITCAVIIAGCSKPADSTASTSPADSTATATTGSGAATTTAGDTAGTTGDTAGTTGAAADSSGNSLVGKWDMTNNTAAPTVYEFKDDGTFTNTVSAPEKDPKFKDTILSTGTYKVDGNNVSQTITSVEASSDNPAEKDAMDKENAALATAVKSMKEMPGTIEWKDKDNAVIKVNQPAMGGQPAKEMEVDLKRESS